MKDQRRNLNPHKAAVAAMFIYGEEYAAQRGGSMDFWDDLSDSKRRVCRELVDKVYAARQEAGALKEKRG